MEQIEGFFLVIKTIGGQTGPPHYIFLQTFSSHSSRLSQSICFPEIDRHFAFVNSEKSVCFNMFRKIRSTPKAKISYGSKSCTLEKNGIGYFPNAPTERGVKHLKELAAAVEHGYKCCLAFVIQVPGVKTVLPNIENHPEFGKALEEAKASGVEVLFLQCIVNEDELKIV